jgi:hypothetical protein
MNFIHIQVSEVRKDNNGNITCINYVACVNFPMNFALWLAVKAKRGIEMMNVLGESFVFAFRERQSFSFNFDFSPEVLLLAKYWFNRASTPPGACTHKRVSLQDNQEWILIVLALQVRVTVEKPIYVCVLRQIK